MKSRIATLAAFTVTITIVRVIIDLIMKREPQWIPAVVSGLAFGITIAAFQHWQNKKKSSRDTTDSQ